MPATIKNTAAVTVEVNIKNYKKQIEALRKQIAQPTVLRNPEKTQQIYDQIEDLKRKIEEYTKKQRKAVPIVNAPVAFERRASKRKTHFTI